MKKRAKRKPKTRAAASKKPAADQVKHYLKTWPEFYAAILDGRKTFEIRTNDRDYKVGNLLVLCEFEPCKFCRIRAGRKPSPADSKACGCHNSSIGLTGEYIRARVTYVTDWKQQEDNVVMGIEVIDSGNSRNDRSYNVDLQSFY